MLLKRYFFFFLFHCVLYLRGIHFSLLRLLERGGNNLFDSSLLLARCGRSTGPMAVARFACALCRALHEEIFLLDEICN